MKFRNKQTRVYRLIPFWVWGCWSALLVGTGWAQQGTVPATSTDQTAQLSALELKTLVQTADRKGARMHQRLVEYTYLQRRLTREAGPKGKVVQQVREYEAYPVKFTGRHQHVLSLIKKDGVPVPETELAQNRLAAARELEQAEAAGRGTVPATPDADKYISVGLGLSDTGEGVWLGVSQFLRQCQFAAPRLMQWQGRETLVVALYSCQVQPANPRENFMRQLNGLVWLDTADRVVVRLEAWPRANALAPAALWAARPATECIVYEQQLLREGLWAPRRIRLNALGQGRVFNGVDKDMSFEFGDYQHFQTEVKEKEVSEPIKKP